MQIGFKPFLIIISSPSGAGKSTLCRKVIENDPLIKLSISTTTRNKRIGEVDGRDYFFVNTSKFEEMAREDCFLEYAKVFDNNYGTPRKMVENELKNQKCVLFDIDWQGARQIRKNFLSDEVVSIFILPPSRLELEKRLRSRAQDSEQVVANRMKNVCQEVSHFNEYDFVLLNDDLDSCYNKICTIIAAKKLSLQNREHISQLVSELSST